MFKLVVLSALLAVAVARPGHLESSPVVYSAPTIIQEHLLEPTIIQEHSLAKVGDIVKSIPTAVSHQSSTIVHHTDHVEPIIAPVVKTYAAAPVVETVHIPVVHTFEAAEPLTIAEPVHPGYPAAEPIAYDAAPLPHAASW